MLTIQEVIKQFIAGIETDIPAVSHWYQGLQGALRTNRSFG
jgi:hypothetical protein